MTLVFNADLAQFVSDYYAIGPQARRATDRQIAEAYIESCAYGEATEAEMEELVKSTLIPQINHIRPARRATR